MAVALIKFAHAATKAIALIVGGMCLSLESEMCVLSACTEWHKNVMRFWKHLGVTNNNLHLYVVRSKAICCVEGMQEESHQDLAQLALRASKESGYFI